MERKVLIRKNDVCRRCLGEGIILVESERRGHNRFTEPTEHVCDLCNGSGLVQVEKDISISITPKTPKPYASKK